MAAGEPTDRGVIAAGLNEYKLARQRQMLERAEQQRPNDHVQRQARAVLVNGIRPATKPDPKDTP